MLEFFWGVLFILFLIVAMCTVEGGDWKIYLVGIGIAGVFGLLVSIPELFVSLIIIAVIIAIIVYINKKLLSLNFKFDKGKKKKILKILEKDSEIKIGKCKIKFIQDTVRINRTEYNVIDIDEFVLKQNPKKISEYFYYSDGTVRKIVPLSIKEYKEHLKRKDSGDIKIENEYDIELKLSANAKKTKKKTCFETGCIVNSENIQNTIDVLNQYLSNIRKSVIYKQYGLSEKENQAEQQYNEKMKIVLSDWKEELSRGKQVNFGECKIQFEKDMVIFNENNIPIKNVDIISISEEIESIDRIHRYSDGSIMSLERIKQETYKRLKDKDENKYRLNKKYCLAVVVLSDSSKKNKVIKGNIGYLDVIYKDKLMVNLLNEVLSCKRREIIQLEQINTNKK